VRDKPTAKQLHNDLSQMVADEIEMSLVIFCGHGYYSAQRRSNVLNINSTESIDSIDLRTGANKRIIILDACREVKDEYLNESFEKSMTFSELSARKQKLSPTQCRQFYDIEVQKCPKQLIVAYSCNINELSGDSTTFGGYYSGSLILQAEEWADTQLDVVDLSSKYTHASFVKFHNDAVPKVKHMSSGDQNPQIDKPRLPESSNHLPFGILA